jgi:hypothetical protein
MAESGALWSSSNRLTMSVGFFFEADSRLILIEVPVWIQIDLAWNRLLENMLADLGLVGLVFLINHHRTNDDTGIPMPILAICNTWSCSLMHGIYLPPFSGVQSCLGRCNLFFVT